MLGENATTHGDLSLMLASYKTCLTTSSIQQQKLCMLSKCRNTEDKQHQEDLEIVLSEMVLRALAFGVDAWTVGLTYSTNRLSTPSIFADQLR
jgi:hypothetical protein